MSTSPLAVVAAQRCRIAVWDAPSLNPYLDIADQAKDYVAALCCAIGLKANGLKNRWAESLGAAPGGDLTTDSTRFRCVRPPRLPNQPTKAHLRHVYAKR